MPDRLIADRLIADRLIADRLIEYVYFPTLFS